jgi:ABC-type oligopeptide transport system ATPase subunit
VSTALLQVRGLTKVFGQRVAFMSRRTSAVRALDGVDLDVNPMSNNGRV